MSVHIIEHVDKNINMSVYIKHSKCTFLCPDIYPENIKNDIWFIAKVFSIHEKYAKTDICTALFSGYLIGEATGIQVLWGSGSVL